MIKSILLTIIVTAGLSSCKQGSKSEQETVAAETFNSVRTYEYTDANGKFLMIQNGFPRGGPYTDPTGKEYFKVIFWSRIINETDSPLELKIDFPIDAYEVPGVPGCYYKILVPPDTMTMDKEPLYDHGITGLQSFLDNNIDKPSSLKRTINPKESSGFYVIFLSLRAEIKPGSTLRTGLILKGQNLVYKISRFASKAGHPLISEKEIPCGRINLKKFILKK